MIKIKNGRCEIDNRENIIIKENLIISGCRWNGKVRDTCWVLEIPHNLNLIEFNRAHDMGVFRIPNDFEYDWPTYDMFWNSNETYVFESYQVAMTFLSSYEGDYRSHIEKLYQEYLELEVFDETLKRLASLENLVSNADNEFLGELVAFINSKELDMDVVLTSMKFFMYAKYREKILAERDVG